MTDDMEILLEQHGDLLFDLCHTLISKESDQVQAFRSLTRKIQKRRRKERYERFLRPWLLSIAYTSIKEIAPRTAAEASPEGINRLSFDDQFLIVATHRHGVPASELALALNRNEKSILFQQERAMRVGAQTLDLIPKIKLPIKARINPLSYAIEGGKRLPWYVRTTLEGAGIASAVLIGVAMVPRVKLYLEQETKEAPFSIGLPTAEFEEEEELASTEEYPALPVHVGDSEIWRFHIKTDSPLEARKQVRETLSGLSVPPDTPGFEGFVAPGGVQFILTLSVEMVPKLKDKLAALSQPLMSVSADSPIRETFTWYKKKTREKIPKGQTRVVIWLSQI